MLNATVACLRGLRGAEIVPLERRAKLRTLRSLRRRNFDVLVAFWTGEKKYRWTKLAVLGLARAT